MTEQSPTRPPRDNIIRVQPIGFELRDDGGGEGDMPTLFGHFARFNEWTEINSMWEGNFLERISPGAFKKTFRENREDIRALFQHGGDPQVGDKPLGPLETLKEDRDGGYYEVPLLDTTYNRDIIPGLEAGLYGASFKFRVLREEIVEEPEASDENPTALPERTIKELRLFELGPVTFPAYKGATAAVRSLTEEHFVARLSTDPERLEQIVEYLRGANILQDVEARSGDTGGSGTEGEPQSGKEDDDAGAEGAPHPSDEQDDQEQDDQAAQDSAGAEPHPDRSGHDQNLYGLEPRQEKPSWLL